MSENLFRFRIGEIESLRIVCKDCKAVLEASLKDLATKKGEIKCPVCSKAFQGASLPYIGDIASKLEQLKQNGNFDIEFSLPSK